jgi:hypothetical protein
MVKKLTNNYNDCQYPSDVERIVKVALAHGIELSPKEAEAAWDEHSDNYAAGWLYLPEDDESIWWDLPAWAKGEEE